MNRRNVMGAVAAGAAVLGLAARAEAAEDDSLQSILKASLAEKKGVTVFFSGGSVAMVVTAINAEFVEGRSRESSRIVVRVASIHAVTMA